MSGIEMYQVASSGRVVGDTNGSASIGDLLKVIHADVSSRGINCKDILIKKIEAGNIITNSSDVAVLKKFVEGYINNGGNWLEGEVYYALINKGVIGKLFSMNEMLSFIALGGEAKQQSIKGYILGRVNSGKLSQEEKEALTEFANKYVLNGGNWLEAGVYNAAKEKGIVE